MSPTTAKKKCKNFLSTLIQLAKDQPDHVASNVKNLVQGIIDGVIQPEDFATQLHKELNSSPQPCLVPFLKVTVHQIYFRISLNPNIPAKSATLPTEDDELSDISTMGGVNFMEEGQKVPVPNEIEAYIRKYKNENFLINQALELKVNTKIRQHGLNELESDVVGIISHATQEYLRNLIEKLAVIAEHRLENIKLDPRFEAAQDVKSQLKFLDELEKLEKKRHEEHEREVLLRAAKLHLLENIIPCLSLNIFVQSRSKLEDPEQVKLKQKAKDMQKAEQEELRHREANATALLAIGPRKKLRIDSAAVATGAQNTQDVTSKNKYKETCRSNTPKSQKSKHQGSSIFNGTREKPFKV
ncbi:Taf4 [Cordylochernes scorpioides]|uniref:Taf4 n=1 Tax=Cordylochernes scorpioides TaxID=51811 RepID=A0ABY6LV91_9ARAC|nr:Taf4 [Cordylochernes scorpioides]